MSVLEVCDALALACAGCIARLEHECDPEVRVVGLESFHRLSLRVAELLIGGGAPEDRECWVGALEFGRRELAHKVAKVVELHARRGTRCVVTAVCEDDRATFLRRHADRSHDAVENDLADACDARRVRTDRGADDAAVEEAELPVGAARAAARTTTGQGRHATVLDAGRGQHRPGGALARASSEHAGMWIK